MKADFDIAANKYDDIFTFSNIGKAQRNLVFKNVDPYLHSEKNLSILEINCGTGEDAIQFAKLDHEVHATDISEGMINVAKAKTKLKNITFTVQDINTITEQTFTKKFDIIFSNFGGLNCLSKIQLEDFFNTANTLLNPNGKLILVLMPKQCIWEQIYFSLKGDFKKAKRRNTDKSVDANVDGIFVKTWYYNPKDILSLTSTLFKKEKIKPIGITIPPSYLENSILAKNPLLSIFKSIDSVITGEFWAKYADHFYIELSTKAKHNQA
ncbi:class I SAM-dependent methyltransferase [Oceanihabitans sp. 2_MG-2023]|uniref:class I SAM-dependent methyltransferase n=1 Tax=Oceanihabitans sp. 2_MG-2023 TaxID=3062661 RepID=UPI0026E3BB53|nr:class I SAM-dependent methyltransferase [Oceanihabitans sp. 2_MG-2023]MDO6596406.1 class I SAM-dependent methyltransferase [Oceanihabitans sp. 2_MG-2023]